MMMGPMKKKVVTTGIIAFLIPCIIFGVIFYLYASKKVEQVKDLEIQSKIVYRYVVSGDKEANQVLTANDIAVAEVKEVSVPADSFVITYSGEGDKKITILDQRGRIIGERLRIPALDRTILTSNMFYEEDSYLSRDSRLKEFTTISIPSNIEEYDYVDIRIAFPTGQDYLVVSGKEVKKLGTNADSNSIFLELNEEEMVRLSAAIIESYIENSINVYAVKYMSTEQLIERKNVDYVEKYNTAVEALLDELYKKDLDEQAAANNGAVSISIDEEYLNKHTVDELSIEDIANRAGLPIDDVANIKKATAAEDKETLAYYKDKVITVENALVPNYPVRAEVAKVVRENPNILETVKARYNVEELEAKRSDLFDTSIDEIDQYTGETKPSDEKLKNVEENLKIEIEAQRAERKEYLQSLITSSIVSQ